MINEVDHYSRDALLSITPVALSTYANAVGWERQETYREYSDIYAGENLPEIIVPRTDRLGDYASVVAELIQMFAQVKHQDESSVYQSLLTTDRDVIRLRTGDKEKGNLPLDQGVDLINGVHDMLKSVACSLRNPKMVYRAGAHQSACDLLSRVRLGHTERGSYVITLVMPVLPPPTPIMFPDDSGPVLPIERLLTVQLMKALFAVRSATEEAVSGGANSFREAVEDGVSANLCEALVQIIDSSDTLDVNVTWASNQPNELLNQTAFFSRADLPILRSAARSFREYSPKPDIRLYGYVRLLTRRPEEEDGTIRLNTMVDNKNISVTAMLERQDYEQAVQAHRDKALAILSGDLERIGQRWQLLNAQFEGVLRDEE